MGTSYAFTDERGDRATSKAARFIRDVRETLNRRAAIVGTVQDKRSNKWRCVVDICGAKDVRIDQIARKYK